MTAAFADVDRILHAGDVYTPDCIEWLERIAPVEAAPFGVPGSETTAPRVSIPIVVDADGHAIGVIHKLEITRMADDIWPGALDRYPAGASLPDDLADIFGRPVDIVVFGYTHEAMVETHQGVLFVNPGSPNMVKQSMKLGTVGILELTADGPAAKIIELASLG